MAGLGFDVLTTVLVNLSSRDIMMTRRVCRNWKAVAEDVLSRRDCLLLVGSDALTPQQVRDMAGHRRFEHRTLVAHRAGKSAFLKILSRIRSLHVVGMYRFSESSRDMVWPFVHDLLQLAAASLVSLDMADFCRYGCSVDFDMPDLPALQQFSTDHLFAHSFASLLHSSKHLKCVRFRIISQNISWHKLPASVTTLDHRYKRVLDTNWDRAVELDQVLRSKARNLVQVLPLVSLEKTDLRKRCLPQLLKIMVTCGSGLIGSETVLKLADLLRPTRCRSIVFATDFDAIHRSEWQQLFSSAVCLSSVTFDCHIEYESSDVLLAIASNCPSLRHLRLIAMEAVTDSLFRKVQEIRSLTLLEIESVDQIEYEDILITTRGVIDPLTTMFNRSMINFRFHMTHGWVDAVGSALTEFAADRQLQVKHYLSRLQHERVGIHMWTEEQR